MFVARTVASRDFIKQDLAKEKLKGTTIYLLRKEDCRIYSTSLVSEVKQNLTTDIKEVLLFCRKSHKSKHGWKLKGLLEATQDATFTGSFSFRSWMRHNVFSGLAFLFLVWHKKIEVTFS